MQFRNFQFIWCIFRVLISRPWSGRYQVLCISWEHKRIQDTKYFHQCPNHSTKQLDIIQHARYNHLLISFFFLDALHFGTFPTVVPPVAPSSSRHIHLNLPCIYIIIVQWTMYIRYRMASSSEARPVAAVEWVHLVNLRSPRNQWDH